MNKISGTIKHVVYKGESGFAVFDLLADSGEKPSPRNNASSKHIVSCVGMVGDIYEGMEIECVGQFMLDPKYGQQFKVKSARAEKPSNVKAIEQYLGSGLIKGIGPATAKKIVDEFGKATLEVIEKTPGRLASIKGITQEKAQAISKSYASLQEMQAAIMFLQSEAHITVNLAIKVYNTYNADGKGISIEQLVKKNPYRLVEDVDGIGFTTADRIARNLGLAFDSPDRIRAGLIYTLKSNANSNGNTYLPKAKLLEESVKLLDLSNEKINLHFNDLLQQMLISGTIRLLTIDEKDSVCLIEYYKTEKNIAYKLDKLKSNYVSVMGEAEIRLLINEFERANSITLHANQREAIVTACSNGVALITGGPGTGKTTIVKGIIFVLEAKGKEFSLCAPTGRAAKRMEESTMHPSKTIHRLLELDPFNYDKDIKELTSEVIIVDEVSMVDAFLMNHLVKRLRNGTSLVLVGDSDQLASVGAGNVLSDLIKSKKFSQTRLTEIYRQSEKSLIVTNAHLINQGKMPIIDNRNSIDFFHYDKTSQSDILENTVELVVNRLPKHLNVEPTAIQVLAPLKKGVCGVNNLNTHLQQVLNPYTPNKRQITISEDKEILRVGDKVMHTQNNYELEWTQEYTKFTESQHCPVHGKDYKITIYSDKGIQAADYKLQTCTCKKHKFTTQGEGVFNGDIGYIIEIKEGTLTVEFEDGRIAIYTKDIFNQLMLAYALSVHKSQGSEWKAVVIPVVSGGPMILTRNLLYTAITRAKGLVVIVGEKSIIEKMVKNNYTKERYSMLKHFLCDDLLEKAIAFELH